MKKSENKDETKDFFVPLPSKQAIVDEKQRIEQLRQELHEHNYRYYVQNQPTISDQEFDFPPSESAATCRKSSVK